MSSSADSLPREVLFFIAEAIKANCYPMPVLRLERSELKSLFLLSVATELFLTGLPF
jgi:hypothetical protein